MSDERAVKGYDDKKEFICVCCGATVLLTKFASAKAAKCETCKKEGRQPNPEVLSKIQTGKDNKGHRPVTTSGDTKVCQCTQCGVDVTVTKFAAPSKVVCEGCKGISGAISDGDNNTIKPLKIDLGKLDRTTLPALDEYYVIPSIINNKRLREVKCPACGKEFMKIIKIVDSSPDRGLIIQYQCAGCYTLVSISEQCRYLCEPKKAGHMYNYRGDEITNCLPALKDTQMRNTIEYLLNMTKILDLHIEGVEWPEYVREYEIPSEKDIPTGFNKEVVDAMSRLKILIGGGDNV